MWWWCGTLVMLAACVVFIRWGWKLDSESIADAWVRYDERVRGVRERGRSGRGSRRHRRP